MTDTKFCPYPFSIATMARVSSQPALMVAELLTSVITRTTSGCGCWGWTTLSFLFHLWSWMKKFSKTWSCLGFFQSPRYPCLLPKGKHNFRAEKLACPLHIPADPLNQFGFQPSSSESVLLSQGQPGQDGWERGSGKTIPWALLSLEKVASQCKHPYPYDLILWWITLVSSSVYP